MRNSEKKQKRRDRRPFIRQFYRKNYTACGICLGAEIAIVAANLLISWIMQQLIDLGSGKDIRFTLGQLTFLVCASVLFFSLILVLNQYVRPQFYRRAMRQYKEYAFKRIVFKDITSFGEANTATYLTALSADAANIETEYLDSLFELVSNCLLFVGALAMMLVYSPVLTAVSLAFAFLPVLASLIAGNRLARQEKRVSDQNAGFLATLKDVLNGFSVVKSFQAEEPVSRLFEESNTLLETAKSRKRQTELFIGNLGAIAGFVAQFGVFLFGTWLALRGRSVTVGMVVVFVNLMNFVISPIAKVPQILAKRKAACALIDKLAGALTKEHKEEGSVAIDGLKNAITVQNLTFGYESDAPVLRNVS